jgi:hypothetical protein
MERTHNHSSPNYDAGLETHPPRPLSTSDMVPYQGEQNVNARAGAGFFLAAAEIGREPASSHG